MGKESKLFDKRFVHFMWDDELEGKQVFVADNINSLIERIEKGTSIYKVHWSRDTGMPFESEDLVRYRFAYYDENYSIKKAFNEGKKVQYRLAGGVDWADIDSEEALKCRIAEGRTFRIKPEDKWIAYLARPKYRDCYLTACAECMWEAVQKEFDAKTKLFVGTCDEAVKWYESREKFTEIIKAWEDGKTIQVYETLFKKWSDCAGTLEWYTDCEYRVKPECPCADGIDSKACVGCEQSEDGKRKYKPYVKVDEFIVELEEQNANLIAMLKAEREVRVNDEFLKGICERNAEIDKLKMGLKWDADNRDELLKENVELEKKLTTAKEIIKDLLFFLNKSYNKDWPMCMDVAEQFLKEVKG